MFENIRRLDDNSYMIEKNGYDYHVINKDFYTEEYKAVDKFAKENPELVKKYVANVYVPTTEDLAEEIRAKRDILLEQADKLLLRYEEELEIGIIEQNDTYRKALLRYKYDLRNIPQQEGFPENVEWPKLPKYKDYE